MPESLIIFFQSLLLVSALSLDAFVASIAYGTNKIKVPFASVQVITFVCSFFLGISLFFGSIIKRFVPQNITSTISFIILMFLGILYLFQGIIKACLAKKSSSDRKVKLKLFDLMIDIYVDETKADIDNSKNLNPREALYLGIALSLDSLAVGFGSSLGNINYFQVILLSLICGALAVWIGLLIGRKLVENSKFNISWLSGVILIILAILKLR